MKIKMKLLIVVLLIVSCGCVEENIETLTLKPTNSDNVVVDLSRQGLERFSLKPVIDVLKNLVGLDPDSPVIDFSQRGLGLTTSLGTIYLNALNNLTVGINLNIGGANSQLLTMFEVITLRIDQIHDASHEAQENLRLLRGGLQNVLRFEITLNTLHEYITPIDALYHRFIYYQKHKNKVEDATLEDFSESAISHASDSIASLMASIHSIVAPSDPPRFPSHSANYKYRSYEYDSNEVDNKVSNRINHNYQTKYPQAYANDLGHQYSRLSSRKSIFDLLDDAVKSFDSCNANQSLQQLIYGLYTRVALTLSRAYTMTTFAYSYLKIQRIGNYTIEKKLTDLLYTHYTNALVEKGLKHFKKAPNFYAKCDPSFHVENKTYVLITELLQGYIENEVDMNPAGSCNQNCAAYDHAEVTGCYLPEQSYCAKHRRCKGRLHGCRYFDADARVCISSIPYRRYEWVRYENKKEIGDTRSNKCKNVLYIDSWWRFLYHCSYCMCLCDDEKSPTSDRFFSLRPAVSDISNDRVVTGVKFVKKNRVIHIQVEEGEVLPQGQIHPNSVRWVPTTDLNIESENVQRNIDYAVLTYEERSIDFDHLTAPRGHVVTGLRFRKLGSHLNLEMWVTPINYTTGEMKRELSYWMSNDNTPTMKQNPRKILPINEPGDPRKYSNSFRSSIEYPHNNVSKSQSGKYVDFGPTSMDSDVSQLTVPFIDAQPVNPKPSSWLEGVQLYHRTNPRSGGFLSFMLFTYNMTENFIPEY